MSSYKPLGILIFILNGFFAFSAVGFFFSYRNGGIMHLFMFSTLELVTFFTLGVIGMAFGVLVFKDYKGKHKMYSGVGFLTFILACVLTILLP